ncbi:MAG TPA: HK97 gp10 family phage protein [Candidatus Eisenbacteria bacterium]|nr:HK97 gp10 family phage protein [Candidatus Eisenbacteria bacterium]
MARVRLDAAGMVRLSRVVDERLVHPVTDAVAQDMRRYVPVLTGNLRSTIRVEHGEGYGRVYFGSVDRGIDYHLYVEFGTSRMAAQPFARPALYQARVV